MSNLIFDIEGDALLKTSNTTAIDSDGHMMMRISDNMALDMESGEAHFVSCWDDQDED